MSPIVIYDQHGRPASEVREAITTEQVAEMFRRGASIGGGGLSASSAYERVPWVYRCVDVIGKACVSAPLDIVARGGSDEVLEEHAAAVRLRKPSPNRSVSELVMAAVMYRELAGNAFWLMDWGQGGPRANEIPTTIVPLNPYRVTVLIDKATDTIFGYEYRKPDGGNVAYEPLEVVHFRKFNPNDHHRGLPTLASAMPAASLDTMAGRYATEFLKNSAQLGGVLINKRTLTSSQKDSVRSQFEERHAGSDKSGRLAVLTGEWTYHETGVPQNKMQFHEQRQFNRETIAAVFGVPNILINKIEDANRSNSEDQMKIFAWYTILPILRSLTDDINSQFCERYAPDVRCRFDTSEMPGLRRDTEDQVALAERLVGMGETYNEAKRLAGLDLKDHPWGDEWWIQQGRMPASAWSAEQIKVEGDKKPDKKGDKKDDSSTKMLATSASEEGDRVQSVDEYQAKELRGMYWRAFLEQIRPKERAFYDRVRRYFMDLRGEMLANLGNVTDVPRENSWKGERGAFDGFISDVLFDLADNNRELKRWSGPMIEDAFHLGGRQVHGDMQIETEFSIKGDLGATFLDRRQNKIVGINETIFGAINDQLRQALLAGETTSEMRGRIRTVMNASASRATTIARTEVATAVNLGRVTGMVQNGVEQTQWITARDEHVRSDEFDHHIDGETMDMGEEFSIGLRWPNDDGASGSAPGNVINCRCTSVPVLRKK